MFCFAFSTAMMAQMEPIVKNFTRVSVSNLSEMKAALESKQNTCITLTKNIAPSDPNVRASELRAFSDVKSDTLDCSYWAEIPSGYYKYLDLNGKKFWVKMKESKLEHACMIYNTGFLTITDNSGGEGEIRFDDYMFDEPKFIPVRNIIYTTANSNVTINGGKLIAGRLKEDWWFTPGVWDNLSEYIYHQETTYDMSDRLETASHGNFPTFSRLIGGSCIVSAGGAVIINGGVLTAHGGHFGIEYYWQSKRRAPGGCISFDDKNAPYFPYIIINGGEMHADAGARAIAAYTDNVKTVSDKTFINRGSFNFEYSEKGNPIRWKNNHGMGVYPYRFIELRGYTGIPFPSVKGILYSDGHGTDYPESDKQEYAQMERIKNTDYFWVRTRKSGSERVDKIMIEDGKIIGELKIEQLDTINQSAYLMPSDPSILTSGFRTERRYYVHITSHLASTKYGYYANMKEGDDLVKVLNKMIEEQIPSDVLGGSFENYPMFYVTIRRDEYPYDVMGNSVVPLDKYVSKVSIGVDLLVNSDHIHSYTSGQVILTKPSCSAVGKKQVFCACGEYIEQEIAKTPHNYSDYYFYTDKVCWRECLECGEEYVPELSEGMIYKKTHVWSTVLIKQGKYKCTRCGYNRDSCHPEEIDKQGDMDRDAENHWWNCPVHTDEADCPNHLMLFFGPHEHFEVGAADYKERLDFLGTGWDYVPGDCQNGWYCKNEECNAFYHKGEVPHVMVKVSETESTCAKQGEITYKCYYDGKYNLNNNKISCTEKKVVKKDPVMHDFEHRPDLSSEPTCTADGKVVTVCKVCGQRSETVVPAHGHECEYYKEVVATCQTEGRKAHYSCNICGNKMLTENGPAVSAAELIAPVDASNHEAVRYAFKDKSEHTAVCNACGKDVENSGAHVLSTNTDGVKFCTGCNAHFADIATLEGEGFATFIGDFDADIPEGARFFTVSKVDANDCVVLVEVDHIVAGVPYLAYNETKADINIAGMQGVNKNLESEEEAQYVFTEGILTGYLKTTPTEAGIYMFKAVNSVPGFYKTDATGFAEASTCSLSFLSETPVVYIIAPSGVDAVKLDADKAQRVYDVLGRQLSAPLKGVNIIDGKKVMK